MRNHQPLVVELASCVAVAVLTLTSLPARAQQLVVADVTYEHSATTTSDSHYRLEPLPGTPANMRSPIDYASGEAYVRLEVFTKPSDAGTRFQVCFEARPTYACTNQAPTYTTTGLYTWVTPFSSFYQGSMVDWSMGLGRIALILKDTMNRKPSPENVGVEESRRYMPTSIRVTVTLVPPGGTYVPPEDLEPDAGTMIDDAGTMSSSDASTPELDAGPLEHDAGTREIDAARGDAARSDAASARTDAGGPDAEAIMGGCSARGGSSSSGPWSLAILAALALGARRRNASGKIPYCGHARGDQLDSRDAFPIPCDTSSVRAARRRRGRRSRTDTRDDP